MQRKFNTSKIFIFASILFLGILIITYGYRFIYFYSLEHQNNDAQEEPTDKTLSEYFLSYLNDKNKMNNITTFKHDEKLNEYYFYNQPTNNYVYYSGRLWRVISIDSSNNVKLITEDIQTSLTYGEENNLTSSYINNWMNKTDKSNTGIFLNTLNDIDKYLVNTTECINEVSSEITCTNTRRNNKIELLSMYEYNRANQSKSYLNIGKTYWTLSQKEKEIWIIDETGGVTITDPNHHYGVKPVITISGNQKITGKGTKDDPIKLETIEVSTLKNASVGEYLKYNSVAWKIIEKNDKSIKIVKDTPLDTQRVFSTKNNTYNTKNSSSSIGYYLNTTYYNSLENKDYIIDETFYIGKYKTDNYDYSQLYSSKITCNVGLLKMGDLFINNYQNILTITGLDDNTDDTIFGTNNNFQVYSNKVKEKYNIHPVINIDNKLIVKSGQGSIDNPYEISR